MGDVGEFWRDVKEHNKIRKASNYIESKRKDDGLWTKHTEYHWSRDLCGKKLDYWPTRNKFQYDGRIMVGDVFGFIRKREKKHSKDRNKPVESASET